MNDVHVFDIDDIATANAVLCAQYTSLRLTPTDAGTSLRIEQQELGTVRMHRVSFRMAAEIAAEPLGTLWVGRVSDGRIVYRHAQTEVAAGPGDVVFAAQPEESVRSSLVDLDSAWAVFEPNALSHVAQCGRGDGPVRLTGFRPVSSAAERHWTATYDYVRQHVLTNPEAAANPLIATHCTQLLAAATLAAFPNDAARHDSRIDRRDAHPETLRRAIAFVEGQPDQPMTTADIARSAHVTVRAVQYAFRRELDTTPMAYLRQVRLDRARADLTDGDATSTTVGAISARWGFLSASRFSAEYKTAYGENPSATLRR